MQHKRLKIALIILAALCVAGASVTPLIVQQIRTSKKGRVVEGDNFNIVVTNSQIGNSLAANSKTRANFLAYHNGKIVSPKKWTLVDGDNLPSPLIFQGEDKSNVASIYIDSNNPNAYIWETKIWVVEAEYETEAGETLTAQGKVKILRSDVPNGFGILCLQNGTNISIPDQATFDQFCVAGPSNTVINLAGQTFLKKDVTHFQFGSLYTSPSIVPEFMSNCINFNNELIIPSSVTSVGDNFLRNCSLFNSDINIDNFTTIGDNFMLDCVKFNRSLFFSASLPQINDNFLKGCIDYNLPISFPASVASIGDGFLEGCASFNQNLIVPITIGSVGNNFLYKCDEMVSKVTINALLGTFPTSDPNAFATDNPSAKSFIEGITIAGPLNNEYCDDVFPNNTASSPYRNLLNPINGIARITFTDGKKVDVQNDGTFPNNPNTNVYAEFNSQICNDLPDTTTLTINGNSSYTKAEVASFEFSSQFNLTTLPDHFLRNFTGLTTQVNIPTCVEVIGNNFMRGCTSYNAPISLPYLVNTIGEEFMSECTIFDSAIDLPNSIQSIGTNFLWHCESFNKRVELPSTLVRIPNGFLAFCYNFDNDIVFPQGTLREIGTYFMYQCRSFNQPLNLAGTITSIGRTFLSGCDSYTSTIDFQNISITAFSSPDAEHFATTNSAAPSYTTGITIKGNNVDKIINIYPNSSATNYRNLKNELTDVIGVARLTLSDGRIVHVPADEFNKLSNHGATNPTNTGPTINGIYFYWNQLVGLEFTSDFNFDKIPASFLRNCTSFNQIINLPTCVKEIGEAFLMGASSYNQPISFPEVEIIAGYFLATDPNQFGAVSSFNETISFPKLKNLGWRFLLHAIAFNQDLVLPMTLEEIGTWFMYGTKSMISSVNFGNLDPGVLLNAEENFATDDSAAPSYTTGITIEGTYSTTKGIIDNNPNRDANPFRKLHDKNIDDCYLEFVIQEDYSYARTVRKIYNLADFNYYFGSYHDNHNVLQLNQATGAPDYPVGGWPSLGPYSTDPFSQNFRQRNIISLRFGKFASLGNPVTGDGPITAIPNDFLRNCTDALNSTIILPETVTSIGNNFLMNAPLQNSSIIIPNSVASIGTNFLHSCTGFNSYINIPTGMNTIPAHFMRAVRTFDQPIDISNVTTISNNFMTDCWSFNKKLTFNSGLTTIGQRFLASDGGGTYGCTAFNQVLDFTSCTSLTTIPNMFLDSNTSAAFNSEVKLPNTVTSIGEWFLNDANHYNKQFIVPTGIDGSSGKKIYNHFMEGLDAMISEVKFSTLVNSDNVLNQRGMNSDSFTTYNEETNAFKEGISLSGSTSPMRLYLNNPFRNNDRGRFRRVKQPAVGANTYARIEYNNGEDIVDAETEADFLRLGDTAMTTTPSTADFVINGVSIPRNSVTAVRVYKTDYIPSWFMYRCQNLKIVELSSSTRILRDHFLQDCIGFNNTIVNLDKITETQDGFLVGCNSYNQPTTFGSGLATIGNWFLSNMSNFNQPVNLSNTAVTVIKNDFLSVLPKFNSSISLKSTTTKLGSMFLARDSIFNQTLSLPNTISVIDDLFLYQNYAFNKPLTMPTGLTQINGGSFLREIPNMVSELNFGAINPTIFSAPPGDWSFISGTSATDPSYTSGINLVANYATTFKSNWPNGSPNGSGRYRRWKPTSFVFVTTTTNTTPVNVLAANENSLHNGNTVVSVGGNIDPRLITSISFGETYNLTSISSNFMENWGNQRRTTSGMSMGINNLGGDVRFPNCVRNIGAYFATNTNWKHSSLVSFPTYHMYDTPIDIGSYAFFDASFSDDSAVYYSGLFYINILNNSPSEGDIYSGALRIHNYFMRPSYNAPAGGGSSVQDLNLYLFMPRATNIAYGQSGWFEDALNSGNNRTRSFYDMNGYPSTYAYDRVFMWIRARFYNWDNQNTWGNNSALNSNEVGRYWQHYHDDANPYQPY
ncbi:MAG: hypothetical protein Ta2E_05310 [Mycoplasmoidaceae bacterium]|nr:MAG: hypothetical protein Ta2E_05310 [Mycoplasmoidaceae bacterium]